LPTEIGNMESLEVIDLGKQIKFSLQYLMKYVFFYLCKFDLYDFCFHR